MKLCTNFGHFAQMRMNKMKPMLDVWKGFELDEGIGALGFTVFCINTLNPYMSFYDHAINLHL